MPELVTSTLEPAETSSEDPGPRTARTVAVIPALNEEATIGSVVVLAAQYVDRVIVIDDGSRDDTATVARAAGATVIRHERNHGKGRAVATALQWARQDGVDALVFLDADGQHDPKEIPAVLGPVLDGEADVNLGIRQGGHTDMPRWRRAGARALDVSTALGTGGKVTDSQTGFRALSRNAIKTLDLDEAGFAVESEMLIKGQQAGLKIAETPVTCEYGELKSSTLGPIRHAAGVLNSITRMIGDRWPLLALGVPALLTFITGVILSAYVVAIAQSRGVVAVGSALLASLFLLAGLTLALAAIILHILPGAIAKQIRRQARDRPTVRILTQETP